MEKNNQSRVEKLEIAYYRCAVEFLHKNSGLFEFCLSIRDDIDPKFVDFVNERYSEACMIYLDASRKLGIDFASDPSLKDSEKERLFIMTSIAERNNVKGLNTNIKRGVEICEQVNYVGENLIPSMLTLISELDSVTGFDRAVIENSIDTIIDKSRKIMNPIKEEIDKDKDAEYGYKFVKIMEDRFGL